MKPKSNNKGSAKKNPDEYKSNSNLRALRVLLIKPNQSILTEKVGFVFEVPPSIIAKRFREAAFDVESRIGEETENQDVTKVIVQPIEVPDIEFAKVIPRDSAFNNFNPTHHKIAGKLIEIFMKAKNTEELLSLAVAIRDEIHPYLFTYTFSVALYHRDDTRFLELPSIVESFPAKFIPKVALLKARREAHVIPPGLREPIKIPVNYTASDLDPEHKLAYFREDIGINQHHWHWHLIYPTFGPPEVVNKDRRGELFYYMHHQILNRYNVERFCHGLKQTKEYSNFRTDKMEGYYPKMDSQIASRAIASRQDGQTWQDVTRFQDGVTISISTIERWANRIMDGIHLGFVINANNERVPLNNNNGIDILGNMVEATMTSINFNFYGTIHNMGHTFFSLVHDPNNRHLEDAGLMGDTSTAMRDIVFYRWHTYIDKLFEEHKLALNSYTPDEFACPGITLKNIQLIRNKKYTNELVTFWQISDFDLSRGLDFNSTNPIYVRMTHLNNEDFTYQFDVNNSTDKPIRCTFRVFLLPVNNDAKRPMNLDGCRRFGIEMDKFATAVRPGNNKILRKSRDSNLTVPLERSFPTLASQASPTDPATPLTPPTMDQNYCACGWPQYMLLPIGTPEGFPFYLYVLLTPYLVDKTNEDNKSACNDTGIFCGIRDKKYPDARPMGFPFDRTLAEATIAEFTESYPNSKFIQCTIKHDNKVINGPNVVSVNDKGQY